MEFLGTGGEGLLIKHADACPLVCVTPAVAAGALGGFDRERGWGRTMAGLCGYRWIAIPSSGRPARWHRGRGGDW